MVLASADEADDALSGRVIQTSFLGNMLRHTVEIEPGVQLTVDVQNAGASHVPRVGDTVALSWRIADGLMLAR